MKNILRFERRKSAHLYTEETRNSIERSGGMNYLLTQNISAGVVSSILFYGITAANNRWPNSA
jgi:hypothetical protein